MKIAFISPKWLTENSYPPLGLAYLAAVMEQKSHEVKIFDLSFNNPHAPIESDLDELLKFAPDIVGITTYTNSFYSAKEAARYIKASSKAIIAMGGPHATVFPEQTAAEPDVDVVVYGEGEETFGELVDCLEGNSSWVGKSGFSERKGRHLLGGKVGVFLKEKERHLLGGKVGVFLKEKGRQGELSNIKGLAYKDTSAIGSPVVLNAKRDMVKNLDDIPFPARHLLEIHRYQLRNADGELETTVMTSRGCPYSCIFCYKGIYGSSFRQRSPENVMAELKQIIQDYGIKNFYFVDDLFTVNPTWLRQMNSLIRDANSGIIWRCLGRVDRVTPEILKDMADSGCSEIHYGIESGNDDILKSINKRITVEQVKEAVKWTKDAGISTKGYFMVGLPGDTEETIQRTIQFAIDLELDKAQFSLTTPLPGTKLWDIVKEKYPHVDFDEHFSKAFYLAEDNQLISPFFNLSQLNEERISTLAGQAGKLFAEGRRRKLFVKTFGEAGGEFIWKLSRNPTVRSFGLARETGSRVISLFAR